MPVVDLWPSVEIAVTVYVCCPGLDVSSTPVPSPFPSLCTHDAIPEPKTLSLHEKLAGIDAFTPYVAPLVGDAIVA